MVGAMRKMAVYLGLVEDDGYDGRGFDPDDEFEPELDPEPSVTGGGTSRPTSRIRHTSPNGTNRYEWCSLRRLAIRCRIPLRSLRNPAVRRGSRPWRPSHKNAQAWRRTHR